MRTRIAAGILALVGLALGGACSSDLDPVDSKTTSQETVDGTLVVESPILLLLAVDDADTPDAAALRGRVADSVRGSMEYERQERFGGCGSPDPAMAHPGDFRIVLVRPSAPDDEALLSPIAEPGLAWITKTSSQAEIDAVTAAATQALEKRKAAGGEAFRPLHALKRATDLVIGARAPATKEETDFIASLPKDGGGLVVHVLVAGTRDDESAETVDSLGLGVPPDNILFVRSAVSPGQAQPSQLCFPDAPLNTRIESWSKVEEADLRTWPCDDADMWEGMLRNGSADCGPGCHAHPLTIGTDGTVSCKLYVDQSDLASCDEARGVRDPDGKETLVDRYGTQVRRCEVIQLSGAELDACRTTLECSGCSPGYCATDVKEVFSSDTCDEGQYFWPLRFVGEPLAPPAKYVHFECQTSTQP